MKQLLITICILATLVTFGQRYDDLHGRTRDVKTRENIDTCLLRVTYDFTHYKDTISGNRFYEKTCLDVGANTAKFYSYYAVMCDSLQTDFDNSAAKKGGAWYNATRRMIKDSLDMDYSEFYFNYPTKGNLQNTRRILASNFYYDEPIENPAWEILADTATVLGYKCQKAIASYHGRTWEAWFTTEIPYQMGPWKLQGLPWLVLNAKTADNLFAYEAVAIEVPQNASIFHFDYKFKKISVRDMRKIERLMGEDVVSVVISHGATIKLYGDEGMVEAKPGDIAPTYIPQLELE